MAKTIELSEPIIVHGGQVKQIVLRDPTYREIMRLGEPFAQGFSRDGSTVFQAENIETIRGYIEALVQPPVDGILIEQLGLADTLRLKDAVFGFFSDARLKLSKTTVTSSSSTSTSSTQSASAS